MKQGYIYKIVSPEGRIYIGKTFLIDKRKNRYKNKNCKSQKFLYRSLNKYGWDKHKFDIIYKATVTNERLSELEILFISFFNSYRGEYGLNLTKGGEGTLGWVPSEESRKKMSIAGKGKKRGPFSEEHLKNLSDGIKKSYENGRVSHRQGKKSLPHVIEAVRQSHLGKPISESHSKRLSECMQGNTYAKGTKRTEDQLVVIRKNAEKRCIAVDQYSKTGEFIKTWDSIVSISGKYNSAIACCCQKKPKYRSVNGYIWRYKGDPLNIEDSIKKCYSKVVQLTKEKELVKEFSSMTDAAKSVGTAVQYIFKSCKGAINIHKGYKWMYAEEYYKNAVPLM